VGAPGVVGEAADWCEHRAQWVRRPALQALVATAIAAPALALPVGTSASVVRGALAVVGAALAAVGKERISNAAPPTPGQTVDSVKADLTEIKEKAHR
jgi:hypothetical protein